MEGRTQQYRDFASLVDVQASPQDQKIVKRYWITANMIKLAAVFTLLFSSYATFLQRGYRQGSYVAAALMVLCYVWYRRRSAKKFRSVLLWDCDPVRELALYGTLVAYGRGGKRWAVHFHYLAANLFYAGRFEDAEKVRTLLGKYYSDPLGQLRCEMLAVQLAAQKKDLAGIEEHCNRMTRFKEFAHIRGMERLYPAMFHLFQKGAYTEMYGIVSRSVGDRSRLESVRKNYWLYQIAVLMEDAERADKHRSFVVQNGGTLWYRAELQD